MTQIAVIGTGYVGLSTGACFSALGHSVVCLDIDEAKIALLQNATIPIVENGLQELVQSGLANGSLQFTTRIETAVTEAEVVFLCLPTPQGDDGSADLQFLLTAVNQIKSFLRSDAVVVNKSTVPVGTAAIVSELIGNASVQVVSNPEFLRQGTAVQDFLSPSRIVIGGDDAVAVEKVANLYQGVEAPILRMKPASAEALKYAANAFLATKLTFINAMADICESVGADIFDISKGLGLDPRIGEDMLNAGPGWGGSCFPKDTRALVNIARGGGYDFALLRGVIETNDHHYARIAHKVIDQCGGSVQGLNIAAWGLTFKANTDDLRDSPAIKILSLLHDEGASISAYDPTAKGNYEAYPWINVCSDPIATCNGADGLVLLTEWSEFIEIDPVEIAKIIKHRRVVDGRNILDGSKWKASEFEYCGIGRS